MSVPINGIILWSGSEASIPSGYVLCDGNNGTPDLRDKFVVGAGSSYSVGDTGGADSHTHSVGTLATTAAGAHDHSPSAVQAAVGSDSVVEGISTEPDHTHSLSGSTTSADSRPPYYALCYIMRTS